MKKRDFFQQNTIELLTSVVAQKDVLALGTGSTDLIFRPHEAEGLDGQQESCTCRCRCCCTHTPSSQPLTQMLPAPPDMIIWQGASDCAAFRPTLDAQSQRKKMEPIDVNGSVHTASKQHQRICIRICEFVCSRPVWIGPYAGKANLFHWHVSVCPVPFFCFCILFLPPLYFRICRLFFFFLLCLKCVTDHSLQVFRQALRWFVSVTALIPFLPAFLRETGISEDMFLFLHKMGIFGWLIVWMRHNTQHGCSADSLGFYYNCHISMLEGFLRGYGVRSFINFQCLSWLRFQCFSCCALWHPTLSECYDFTGVHRPCGIQKRTETSAFPLFS